MALLRGGDNVGDQETFLVTVTKSFTGELSTGTAYIHVYFADDQGNYQQKKLWLTDKGWEQTEKALKLLGWDPEDNEFAFSQLNEGEASPIVGAACQIVVVETRDQNDRDKVWSEVAWVNPPDGGGPVERMDKREAVSFEKRVRKQLGLRKGRKPASSGPSGGDRTRKEQIKQAAGEGARRQGGGGGDTDESDDEDYDFDDIPFSWALLLLPLLQWF